MKTKQTTKEQHPPLPARIGSEIFVLQVLEANYWVDVHVRGALTSVERAKRIYRQMCKENPGKAEPVCGMRVIMCHFTHYGELPTSA